MPFFILSVMFLILGIINVGFWYWIAKSTNPYNRYERLWQIIIRLLYVASALCLLVHIAITYNL